jgi:hypothetical protein
VTPARDSGVVATDEDQDARDGIALVSASGMRKHNSKKSLSLDTKTIKTLDQLTVVTGAGYPTRPISCGHICE